MDYSWDSGKALQMLLDLHGKEQWLKARPCLGSMVQRFEFARIHYHDAKGIVDPFIETKLADKSILQVAFGEEEEKTGEFYLLMTRAAAYVTAMGQALHAVPDTASHAIYYTLAMNQEPSPLRSRGITAKSVAAKLEGRAEFNTLHDLLTQLNGGGKFDHLDAVVNTSKHRSVVRPSLNEDVTGTRPDKHVLMLDSVKYEGRSYPAIPALEFFGGECDRLFLIVLKIGNELNNLLEARVGAARRPTGAG